LTTKGVFPPDSNFPVQQASKWRELLLILNLVAFAVLEFLQFSKAFLALHNIAFWCAVSKRKRQLSLFQFSSLFP
jgi:hypothetical protein